MSEQIKQFNLQVVTRKVSDLVPYERNARWHPENQINQIVESIKKFGWTNPILIDSQKGIISGHGRLEAAKKLGLVEVPTIEISGLSEAEKRALILSENQIAANAGWDTELLSVELSELKDLSFDLTLTGFSEIELERLLPEEESDEPESSGAESSVPDQPTKETSPSESASQEPSGDLITCPKCSHKFKN